MSDRPRVIPASDEVLAHARGIKLRAKVDQAVELVHGLVHDKGYDKAIVKVSVGAHVAVVKCCSCGSCGGDVYLIEGEVAPDD